MYQMTRIILTSKKHQVPLGSLQRAGDNVLAVTLRSSMSHIFSSNHTAEKPMKFFLRLARKKSFGPDDGNSGPVFFDLLGLGMICLPSWAATVTNLSVVAAVGFLARRDVMQFSKKMEMRPRFCTMAILILMVSELVSLVAAAVISSILGLMLGSLGMTMSWYSRPYLLPLLYSCPTLFALLIVLDKVKMVLNSRAETSLSEEFFELFSFHAMKVFFAVITFSLTVLGIKSAFFFTFTLLFVLAWELAKLCLTRKRGWASFLLYQLAILVPLALWAYVIQLLVTIFLPIMGRRGATGNPDIILGVAVSLLTIFFLHLVLPVLLAIRKQCPLRSSASFAFSVGIFLLLIGYGFPYSSDLANPAPQRLSLYHVAKEEGGRVEAGYLVGRWDNHWSGRLEDEVPMYKRAVEVEVAQCEQKLGCGLPLHRFAVM